MSCILVVEESSEELKVKSDFVVVVYVLLFRMTL